MLIQIIISARSTFDEIRLMHLFYKTAVYYLLFIHFYLTQSMFHSFSIDIVSFRYFNLVVITLKMRDGE